MPLTRYSDKFPAGSRVIVQAVDPRHNWEGTVLRPTKWTNPPTPDWRIVREIGRPKESGLCIPISMLEAAPCN